MTQPQIKTDRPSGLSDISDPDHFKMLTPGPLSTALDVREEMLHERFPWDDEFQAIVEDVRQRILKIAHADPAEYETILMQGSGTYGVESVLSSVPGPDDHVLVLVNGIYSERMVEILTLQKTPVDRMDCPLTERHDPAKVAAYLDAHPEITIVSMVHNETTTGILNDIATIGGIVKSRGRTFIVDCVSSFAAVDIDFPKIGIDFAITSSNKCVQGVPGFSVVIAKRSSLAVTKGHARSVSLDIYRQAQCFDENPGVFRFTPPTHAVCAFWRALIDFEAEGGQPARYARYFKNNRIVREGLEKLGFKPYLSLDVQGPILNTFHYPSEDFDFKRLREFMRKKGFVLFPGGVTPDPTIRLGNIGELYEEDERRVVKAFEEYMAMIAEEREERKAAS